MIASQVSENEFGMRLMPSDCLRLRRPQLHFWSMGKIYRTNVTQSRIIFLFIHHGRRIRGLAPSPSVSHVGKNGG